jgi:hypothetical protein
MPPVLIVQRCYSCKYYHLVYQFSGNAILGTVNDAKLVNPFNSSSFDPTPFGSSPLATGGSFTDPKLQSFFTQVTFRGAVPPVVLMPTGGKVGLDFNTQVFCLKNLAINRVDFSFHPGFHRGVLLYNNHSITFLFLLPG